MLFLFIFYFFCSIKDVELETEVYSQPVCPLIHRVSPLINKPDQTSASSKNSWFCLLCSQDRTFWRLSLWRCWCRGLSWLYPQTKVAQSETILSHTWAFVELTLKPEYGRFVCGVSVGDSFLKRCLFQIFSLALDLPSKTITSTSGTWTLWRQSLNIYVGFSFNHFFNSKPFTCTNVVFVHKLHLWLWTINQRFITVLSGETLQGNGDKN